MPALVVVILLIVLFSGLFYFTARKYRRDTGDHLIDYGTGYTQRWGSTGNTPITTKKRNKRHPVNRFMV